MYNPLCSLLKKNWLNPFDPEQEELVSLLTTEEVPPEVSKDLLDASQIGEEAY